MDSEAKLNLGSVVAMIFAILYLLLHIFWASPLFGQELTGQQIMEEGWASYRSIPEEEETMEIFTIPRPHQEWYTVKEVASLRQKRSWAVIYKKIIRQLRYDQTGEDKIHIIFLEPPRDKNTSFLFWRHWGTGKADDIWGWFSALRRIRRIASPDQRDSFMGTTLTFEDVRRLVGERLDDFIITLAGEETLAGVECYKIILDTKKEIDTGYDRREFWRQKSGLPAFLEIRYYRKGKLIKRQKNSEIYEFRPGVWRPRLVEMRNIRNNYTYTSLLYFIQREVKKFEDRNFEISVLEREGK